MDRAFHLRAASGWASKRSRTWSTCCAGTWARSMTTCTRPTSEECWPPA